MAFATSRLDIRAALEADTAERERAEHAARLDIRAALKARAARRIRLRAAENLGDWQTYLRAAERAARTDTVGALRPDMSRETRDQLREQFEARRRSALSYPLTADELDALCTEAVETARHGRRFIPEADRDDVQQDLLVSVLTRLGPNPPRIRVEKNELRSRALWLWMDLERKRERATGRRAAYDELREWSKRDKRAARIEAMKAGGDVLALAGSKAAPPPPPDPREAERIAHGLRADGLVTYLQADAVRVALSTNRRRRMSNTERQHWHVATAKLRKLWHSPDMVRAALRPVEWSARLLVEAALIAEVRRADIGSRGGHLARVPVDMSGRMPARVPTPPSAPVNTPPETVGETQWSRHGSGHAGACSVLHLYRAGGRR